MNVDTKAKLLLKIDELERVYVDLSPTNVTFSIHVKFGIMYMLSHMSTPCTLLPAYKTLDYEC